MTSSDEIGLRYRVRVLLTHPEEDLHNFTQVTGLSPCLYWVKGSKHYAPNGDELSGTHKNSLWSYWVDVENSREFASTIAKVIDILSPGKTAFRNLVTSNGQAMLIIELRGDRNIGDIISPTTMAKLFGLGLSFGIEVFP